MSLTVIMLPFELMIPLCSHRSALQSTGSENKHWCRFKLSGYNKNDV